ncbi:MAG: HAD family hydrolase, partial [Acidimicrobiia bacterium]|nr:HAD family hydrolase [Acidimicrobiia bacterium]
MDEPLYAHFLSSTGLDHPGRPEILEAGPVELEIAIHNCESPVLEPHHTVSYQKQMAHHLLPDMALEWIARGTNFLLIRHPYRVLASYTKVRSSPTIDDLGFPQLHDLQQRFGPLPVIDAD